jgi:hypothetical protein
MIPILGQVVTIKPEFQDCGDDQLTFVVASLDNYPRISLTVVEQGDMPIRPIYTVTESMIMEELA